MPDGLTFAGMGRTVRLDFDDSVDAADAESLVGYWADLATDDVEHPALRVRVTHSKHVDSPSDADVTITTDPQDSLGQRSVSRITLALLPLLQGEAIMLHAAAIAREDGAVIGFVGPSGRGKTTAVSVLGTSYRYVTDETLVIHSDLSVTPYAKPLLVGRKPAIKSAHSASSMGLRTLGDGSLHLAALVVLDRVDDVAEPRVLPVDMAESLVLLAEQSSYLTALDHPLADLAEVVQQTGGVRRVQYTEARTLPGVIDDILAMPPADVDFEKVHVASVDASDDGEVVYRRMAPAEAVRIGDRLVVLHDEDRISVLTGIGPVVWESADGVSETSIREAALREFPDLPPGVEPTAAIRATLDEMTEKRILLRVSPAARPSE